MWSSGWSFNRMTKIILSDYVVIRLVIRLNDQIYGHSKISNAQKNIYNNNNIRFIIIYMEAIKHNLICEYCKRVFVHKQNAHKHRTERCQFNPFHPKYKPHHVIDKPLPPVIDKPLFQAKKLLTLKIASCQFCEKIHNEKCVFDPTHHLYDYVNEYIKTCKSLEEIEKFVDSTRKIAQKLPLLPSPMLPKKQVYFNVDFDLYKVLCDLKGKKWAHNYIFYTMHNSPYIKVISEYIIKPNTEQSPIRVRDKTLLIIHQNKDTNVIDIDWQIFLNCLKNIIQNTILKAWQSYNDAEAIDNIREMAYRINQLTKPSDPENYKNEEIEYCQLRVDNVYNKILGNSDGTIDSDRVPMDTYNKLLVKVANYHLIDKDKKEFLKILPKETFD
jgi:hypothetical protein